MGVPWFGPQQPHLLPIEDELEDPRLVSQMDAGRPQIRLRFTDPIRIVRFTTGIVLTGIERQEFETWFANTLRYGSLPVDLQDPLTDTVAEFVFRAMPKWSIIVGGTADSRLWQGQLELWRLP